MRASILLLKFLHILWDYVFRERKKQDQVKPQGGNILTFIFASDTESLFSSYFRERSHQGGSGQCFHHLFSFPKSACIILHSCWADVKVGGGEVGLKIWHKSPGSLYAEDKHCKQTMINMSGRHLLWVRCLIIRHRTSFKGYFIIFNGRGFGKIINLIFGYAGSSLLYTGFFL